MIPKFPRTEDTPMADYRPRPNDNLVEPLFRGLDDAAEPAKVRLMWPRWHWLVLLALVAALMMLGSH